MWLYDSFSGLQNECCMSSRCYHYNNFILLTLLWIMLCRQLTPCNDSSEAVSHLLKSERHIFSEIYISQKKNILNMNVIFLSLEDAIWNSEDWQKASQRLNLFSVEKPSKNGRAALRWRVTVHTWVYNKDLLFCHLDVRRCWATQCNA